MIGVAEADKPRTVANRREVLGVLSAAASSAVSLASVPQGAEVQAGPEQVRRKAAGR